MQHVELGLVYTGIRRRRLRHCRGVVSTGPLARGHLIWALGHLLLDCTGPDWPPNFKAYFMKKIINQFYGKNMCTDFISYWFGPPKFVSHWPGWATNFQNLTTTLHCSQMVSNLLPTTDVVWGKVMFSRAFVCSQGGLPPRWGWGWGVCLQWGGGVCHQPHPCPGRPPPPPHPTPSPPPDRVNRQSVCILLECILVLFVHSRRQTWTRKYRFR